MIHLEPGKVSVLIITYNRTELLKEAIESVRNQTYKNFEIIVVDDQSKEIDIELYDKVDLYCYQKHGGIAKARNRALDLARGEYFFMFCDDDTLHPQALEKMVKAIEGHDACFCDLKYTGAGKGMFKAIRQNFADCLRQKKIPGAGLYRTETVGEYRYGEQFDSACDYDFILNILHTFPEIKIGILSEPLYYYRIHNAQERGSHREVNAANKIKEYYAKKK